MRLMSTLNNELYQRCLVACCLEMAISSNKLPCDFPLLLQILKLAPYHFVKVIEPVLRLREGLPCTLFRDLAKVEEKILESLAWTSDSPLWEDIRANEGQLPTCQQVMPPNMLDDPSRTDLAPDGSLPGAPADHDQQPSTSDQNRQRRSKGFIIFARKVYMLMSLRLKDLCYKLKISEELRMKIWTCFKHSLVHFTDLMMDRHLDQLLMCAIYIIPQITGMDLTFKRIMEAYMDQQPARESVYQKVLISGRNSKNSSPASNNISDHSTHFLTPDTPSAHYPAPCQEERGNLNTFYDQVYHKKMENFAKQFAPPPGVGTPRTTPYPVQNRASPRRNRLPSNLNISLYNRESTRQRTPIYTYYFSSSSSERLREINNMISGRIPNKRSYASSMNGAEEEEGDGCPLVRRRRLDGPSALNRRLREVENDRAAARDRATCRSSLRA
ncbi:retinoblastoma-like protein 2 isoform X2 [Cheilinus undulatus]|uniref:retinoblastoma-like protein 2 isoform X2 n=1 Tax=Cheilinus undulatus TaxID=241271 RepID=UPI001BD5A002|nr:retinoblastoma-like protein 2 isoform X2 [Cheilinus undulatus]